MNGTEEKSVNATIHNFKNEWKYKLGAKANASGRWQIEASAHSNTLDLFVEEFVALLEDSSKLMKARGFPPVDVKEYKQKKEEK